ncbi:hypothetical protein EGH82_23345 [Vibrio ponticus]|uniref:Uncharacterized protein n=1 Tax=Vibrio ponticus TaxID=265668 RepID=A0A3N3DQJ1_9VIBR|nr:hypothetical protein EGH82_23345 [Vibrio ponticus]
MTLWQINVGAKNAVDEVGFAELNIHPPRMKSDITIDIDSIIQARNCDAFVHQWKDETWSGALGCYFYFHNKKVSKDAEFNIESIYFDFSRFDDETIINYDILAGEKYRSFPLNPKTGE